MIMIFSKRLSGYWAQLAYLSLALFSMTLIITDTATYSTLFVLVLLSALTSTLIGTLGWWYCQRKAKQRWVYSYFALQSSLITATMFLETQTMRYGPAASILWVGLMLHAAVLPIRWRVLVFVVAMVVITIFFSHELPPDRYFDRLATGLVAVGAIMLSIVIFGTILVREERALHLSRNLSARNQKLAAYATEAEELATLRERNRLAREIHDNLGHYLTAINMQLEVALIQLPPDQTDIQSTLTKAQALTKEGLVEIRRSVHALRAHPMDNRTLHEALQYLVQEQQSRGIAVNYQLQGQARPCSAAVEITLYRAVQEGFTNIVKHAQATTADLCLNYTDNQHITLTLADNGIGCANPNDGYGLLGIRERAHLLGGEVTVQSNIGYGFCLQVMLPT